MAEQKSSDVGSELFVAQSIISKLQQKGIKLLALDFDKTILDIHTGGCWRGPSTKLVVHVRPCMKALLEAALVQTDLEICIVTYSTQPSLIEDVLRGALVNCDVGRIIIRAVTKDWLPQGATTASSKSPDFLGKEEHIVRVLTDLYNQRRVIIPSQEVLLIDDDAENIRLAEQFGHVAFKVDDNVELSQLVSFADGLPAAQLQADEDADMRPFDVQPSSTQPIKADRPKANSQIHEIHSSEITPSQSASSGVNSFHVDGNEQCESQTGANQ